MTSLYNLVKSMEIFSDLIISLYHFVLGMFFAIIFGIPIGMEWDGLEKWTILWILLLNC